MDATSFELAATFATFAMLAVAGVMVLPGILWVAGFIHGFARGLIGGYCHARRIERALREIHS